MMTNQKPLFAYEILARKPRARTVQAFVQYHENLVQARARGAEILARDGLDVLSIRVLPRLPAVGGDPVPIREPGIRDRLKPALISADIVGAMNNARRTLSLIVSALSLGVAFSLLFVFA